MAIVTTKAVKNDRITRGPQPLDTVTTKDIEVPYIDKEPPFEPVQGEPLTTHNFEDIAEKNRRDRIASEQAVFEAWKKKEAEEKAEKAKEETVVTEETLSQPLENEGFESVEAFDDFPDDILIGTLANGELVGLYDPDWQDEPVRSRK